MVQEARLLVAQRVIGHATEALRIVQDRYREGLTTITEVLRAETALVRGWGGQARALPFVDGYSTSALVQRIRG